MARWSAAFSGVDESPLPAKACRASKSRTRTLFAGSINTEALLRVRVTKARQTTHHRPNCALVEEARSARAPTDGCIDRFSASICPAVVGWLYWSRRGPACPSEARGTNGSSCATALLADRCPCVTGEFSVPASNHPALSTGRATGVDEGPRRWMKAAAAGQRMLGFARPNVDPRKSPPVTDVQTIVGDETGLLALAAE